MEPIAQPLPANTPPSQLSSPTPTLGSAPRYGLLAVVIGFAFSILFAATSVFLYMLNQDNMATINQLLSHTASLQSKQDEKKARTIAPQVIPVNPDTAQVGDKVGDFTIAKITKDANGGIYISFSGTTTVKGYFSYNDMLGEEFVVAPEDEAKIPHLLNREGGSAFLIRNTGVYKKLMKEKGLTTPGLGLRSGPLEVTVTNYLLVYAPKEGGDGADVVSINYIEP
jgi:hypothetical protein